MKISPKVLDSDEAEQLVKNHKAKPMNSKILSLVFIALILSRSRKRNMRMTKNDIS